MCVVSKLHEAGVIHGDLLNPRHFLAMNDGTLRIVDFSAANAHSCLGAHPLTLDTSGDARPAETCSELNRVESRYGIHAERFGKGLRTLNELHSGLPC